MKIEDAIKLIHRQDLKGSRLCQPCSPQIAVECHSGRLDECSLCASVTGLSADGPQAINCSVNKLLQGYLAAPEERKENPTHGWNP